LPYPAVSKRTTLLGIDSETRAVAIRDRLQTVGVQPPRHLQHQLAPVAVGWSPFLSRVMCRTTAKALLGCSPSCSSTSLEVKATSDPSEVVPLTSILIVWPSLVALMSYDSDAPLARLVSVRCGALPLERAARVT
jgi:hypothetical protein